MTTKELAKMVQHLDWDRDSFGMIRCANGDCPILAAYRIMFPEGELVGQNENVYTAGDALELSYDDAVKIVNAADDPRKACQVHKASEILALVMD